MRLVLLFSLTMIAPGIAQASGQQPFTVRDSIELTRLLTPLPLLGHAVPSIFKFSPDGRSFVTVVRSGNLVTGTNNYRLLLFDAARVRAYIDAAGDEGRPDYRVLASFETASDRDAIEQVAWQPSGTKVCFLGRNRTGSGQAFCAEIENGRVVPLTDDEADVTAFDHSESSREVVYSTYSPPDWKERNGKGYVVENFYPTLLLGARNPQDVAEMYLRYFIRNTDSGQVTAVRTNEDWIAPGAGGRDIAISGASGLALISKTVLRIPKHWIEYDSVKSEPIRGTSTDGHLEIDETFGMPDFGRVQYHVVDLRSGSVRPLVDAPSEGGFVGWSIPPQWSPNGTYVVLPRTYMPRADNKHTTTAPQRSVKPVVVVDSRSGRAWAIEPHWDVTAETIAAMGWHSDNDLWIRYFLLRSVPQEVVETFRFKRDQWRSVSTRAIRAAPPGSATAASLRLRVLQDMNTPPDISAQNTRTGREKRITALNPQLSSKKLGIVQIYKWQDAIGRQFVGGLVLPPDYDASRRYPLVIQGGGFYPEVFLVDGPTDSHSPHAARALANREMLVLQIPDERLARGVREQAVQRPSGADDKSETELYLMEIEAAIEALNVAGKIDTQRIGLLGFSRIGMRMNYALTFSKYRMAAATVADSIALTPYCYSLFYGRPAGGGMDTFDTLPQGSSVGAPFWGDGIKKWEQNSYLFHLDSIRTPIRYEEYGTYQIGCSWESFANLKRHDRPVEMIHLPLGEHVLRAPWHQLTSKQGNVDWFDFWLNGREDAADEKHDQYQRWRRLRAQQKAVSASEQSSASFQ